jgi:hypothetical protein
MDVSECQNDERARPPPSTTLTDGTDCCRRCADVLYAVVVQNRDSSGERRTIIVLCGQRDEALELAGGCVTLDPRHCTDADIWVGDPVPA